MLLDVNGLPPVQQREIARRGRAARSLARQATMTEMEAIAFFEALSPGFGMVLQRLTRQPEMLKRVKEMLESSTLKPPVHCINGGFGGI
jgi:hypothetical protein